ncbi:MAG: hypothetical protein O3A46_14520 [Candidatus Poribacteria bacterium]|nr:hypothetical protein [Candidatus Poribacteria bacterium]
MRSVALFILVVGLCVIGYGGIQYSANQPEEGAIVPGVQAVTQRMEIEKYEKALEKRRGGAVTMMVVGAVIFVGGGVAFGVMRKRPATA